jgi:hypothetical protein
MLARQLEQLRARRGIDGGNARIAGFRPAEEVAGELAAEGADFDHGGGGGGVEQREDDLGDVRERRVSSAKMPRMPRRGHYWDRMPAR